MGSVFHQKIRKREVNVGLMFAPIVLYFDWLKGEHAMFHVSDAWVDLSLSFPSLSHLNRITKQFR